MRIEGALSDAARALAASGIAYCGPAPTPLARCYDKWVAQQTVGAAGIAAVTRRMPIDAPLSWSGVLVGLAAAAVTGLVAGVFPARRLRICWA